MKTVVPAELPGRERARRDKAEALRGRGRKPSGSAPVLRSLLPSGHVSDRSLDVHTLKPAVPLVVPVATAKGRKKETHKSTDLEA